MDNEDPLKDLEEKERQALAEIKRDLGEDEAPATKESAQQKIDRLAFEYIPTEVSARMAYEDVVEAVSCGHTHESYLSLKQLANAIIVGLSHWGSVEIDGTVLAKEIAFLSKP